MRSFRSLSKAEERGMLAWLWLAAVVVAADQLTKWMAEAYLELHQPVPVIPHLNWTLAYNEGAAFSFLAGLGGVQRWIFAALAIAVSLFIIHWLRRLRKTQTWGAVGLALVLGGAVGNLIDRLLYGKVIDFIDFYLHIHVPFLLPNGHFATFNVADIAITVGAALLVFLSLFKPEQME